jgi:RNA polymerase sigma-70 factor (ECF subfamily)
MGVVSDAELMRSWQRGDASAFAELVRRWQQPIARFLHHQLGGGDLASDLCQEVFLRVYRAGSTYRAEAAFSTWLYRIAINVARDAARKQRARTARNDPGANSAFALPDVRALPPARSYERQELGEVVGRLLAELPEEQRLVLVLRHYEEVSFEEIARLTRTPASTIKSRFAAALQRLRRRLEELGWGPEEICP